MTLATNPAVIFIVGPTASGKSEAGYLLARELNGEIISADSMQVYRGMDVATAKPPREWRHHVPHHLIDVADPAEEYSAGKFCRAAREAISDIVGRGKVPVIVGGTGLYVRSLLKGMIEAGEADKGLRAKLNEELETYGVEYLFDKLRRLDPKTAESIDRRNPRRVIRAIEVVTRLQRPMSEILVQWKGGSGGIQKEYQCVLVGLSRTRDDLYARIDARVEEMFSSGLREECARLIEKGIERNKVAMQALGYRDVIANLRDELTLEEAKENIKRRTRNFAKRQMTWFKKEDSIKWIDVEKDESAGSVLKKIQRSLPVRI